MSQFGRYDQGRNPNQVLRQDNGNGRRQKTVQQFVALVDTVKTMTCHCTITVPSVRLSGGFEFFFGKIGLASAAQLANLNTNGSAFYLNLAPASATARIMAQTNPIIEDVDPGIVTYTAEAGNLHIVKPVTALPYSYEVNSAVTKYDVLFSCKGSQYGGAGGSSIDWYIRCRFEPNDSSITDDELQKLFDACTLKVGVPVYT